MNGATRLQQATVLIGVALLIGAGACLLHAGDHSGEDVCFGLVAVTTVPVLPFVPTVSAETPPPSGIAFPRFHLDLAAPPPRV